jgi:hypothetical protein
MKVKFDEDVILEGRATRELTLRKPKVKDIRISQKAGDEIEAEMQLIRLLSGKETITTEEFDEMPWSEYQKIQKAIEGLG